MQSATIKLTFIRQQIWQATTKRVAAPPLRFSCKGRDACTSRGAAPSNIKCFYPLRGGAEGDSRNKLPGLHQMAQRRDPCRLFRKGRDAGFFRPGFVHGISCGAAPMLLTNSSSLSQFPPLHLTSSFINHRHFTFFRFFFPFFMSFYPHFISKMGPFNPFKSIRVPYLHHLPRLPYFFIINDNLPP